MKTLNVAVVGTGWIGSVRARAGARQPIVENRYIAEIRPEVSEEVGAGTGAAKVTADCKELLGLDLDAVRLATGPDVHLRPDANQAWTARKAISVLRELEPQGLQFIEQPTRRGDQASAFRAPGSWPPCCLKGSGR